MKRIFLLWAAALLFSGAASAEPLKVVVSFSILDDLVHQVGGSDVAVTSLVGPDSDAHAFEPSPADVKAIAGADLVIVSGLGFEGWLDRLTESAGFKGRVIVASDGITPLMIHNAVDPHAWQNVGNGKLYVSNIMSALMQADPAHAEAYEKNAAQYLRQLGELDIWVRGQIERIPRDKRLAITSHDALNYFAQAYGITFIAPLGLSTSGDVSAGDIAKLIDQIRQRHVRAVFMENMTDPRLIKQLVTDGGAVMGGTLYSDALSKPDGPASTYILMFHHNVDTMVAAMIKN